MNRVARALSELGHYHVMLKGCAGQLIFEDDDDRLYFLNLLNRRLDDLRPLIFAFLPGASWTIMFTCYLMISIIR